MKYLFSIVFILIVIIVISLIYYEPATTELINDQMATSTMLKADDMDFFDCLEYSHAVTGEGILAREAALQSVVTKIVDFAGVQIQKVKDCF